MIVRQADPDTKMYGAQFPERAGWTTQAVLIGQAVDALNWLRWAKTKDGSKNRNRPETVLPVERGRRRRGQQRPGAAPKPSTLSRIREMLPGNQIDERERNLRVHKLFG